MGLNLDKIRERQAETAKKSGGNYFRCQEGKNTVRIFPFEHLVTKDDVRNGVFPKEKLGKKVTELDRPVTRFFREGGRPILCDREDHPLMVQYKAALQKAGKDKAKREALSKIRPTTSYMLNVVDTASEDAKVVEYACPKSVYGAILDYVLDPELGEEILGRDGRDFIITFDKSKQGAEMYSVRLRDADKCEQLGESLEDGIKDFYDPNVYATLGETSDGEAVSTEDTEDEDLSDDGDEDKKEVNEDKDDDDLSDEDDDDEEPKKKAPLAKKGKK